MIVKFFSVALPRSGDRSTAGLRIVIHTFAVARLSFENGASWCYHNVFERRFKDVSVMPNYFCVFTRQQFG